MLAVGHVLDVADVERAVCHAMESIQNSPNNSHRRSVALWGSSRRSDADGPKPGPDARFRCWFGQIAGVHVWTPRGVRDREGNIPFRLRKLKWGSRAPV